MPTFTKTEYVDVDVDLDIDVHEFFSEMDSFEREEMLELLKDYSSTQAHSYSQEEFLKSIETLKQRYYSLSKEDEDLILKIAKKY